MSNDGPAGLEPRDEDLRPAPATPSNVVPYADLIAPRPLTAAPPASARWLAFAAVLLGGLLCGLIGYGTGDLLGQSGLWAAIGGLLGGLIGAVGVGVVAGLTLRVMGEWKSVQHPEADFSVDIGSPLEDDDHD